MAVIPTTKERKVFSGRKHRQWEVLNQMPLGSMICMEMFGNGALIFMLHILPNPKPIQKGQPKEFITPFVAQVGFLLPDFVALREEEQMCLITMVMIWDLGW
jgi:hypothetical protein